jgi:adenylate cyclase
LNPNAARIHLAYGWFLMTAGRFDEAQAEMERAQELDPSSMTINRSRGRLLYFMRQYDRAIEQYRKIVELDPSVGINHWSLAVAYEQKGMYAEAIEGYAAYNGIMGFHSPEEIEQYREIFRASGWQGYVQKTATGLEEKSKKEYASPGTLARVFARADNRDRAFAWLEKAFEARDPSLVQLKIEPLFDGLRSDPRYIDLLRRINLTP